MGFRLRQIDDSAGHLEQLAPQRCVLEARYQRVGYRSAHHTRQRGQADLRCGAGLLADKHPVEPLDEAVKWFVGGQHSHGYRVELKRIGRASMLDCMVDHPLQQQLPSVVTAVQCLGSLQCLFEAGELQLGGTVTVEAFEAGARVKISGTSKGKGFQGTIKRHNFASGPKSHGSHNVRAPGSIGASATPSRVFKGIRGPGQMGNKRVTQKGLEIVAVDEKENLLLLRGSVPGPTGGVVEVRSDA